MKAKYIVVENSYGDNPTMFIFPPWVIHRVAAVNIGGNVVSAGFIEMWPNPETEIVVTCYGESESLRVKSRPDEDSFLARKLFDL